MLKRLNSIIMVHTFKHDQIVQNFRQNIRFSKGNAKINYAEFFFIFLFSF